MVSDFIIPGIKIELTKPFKGSQKKEDKKKYYSKLLDLMDEETAKISVPIENGLIVPLEIGDKYQVIFYTQKGLYHCKGEIVERYKEGIVAVFIIRFESDLEKYQRRKYYRLVHMMEVQYRVITMEEISYTNQLLNNGYQSEEERKKLEAAIYQMQSQWNLATVLDISGGGCRFLSKFQHEAENQIEMRIQFSYRGEAVTVKYDAVVISSTPIEARKGYYEQRAEFGNIESKDRELLIKYIFEEERKIRQRERGLG